MKIELMEYLSNEITDFNLLKQMIVALDKISFENMEKLIKTLKECDYNEYVYEVAVNSNFFEYITMRTIIEDQIRLMETLKEYDYNKYAYELAVHTLVLEDRTIEEQIKLIKILKECDYNEYVYEIAVNTLVLKNRIIEEQIKLMKEMKICHSENIEKIANLAEFKMYLEKLKKELGRDADVNNYTKVLRFKPEIKEEK